MYGTQIGVIGHDELTDASQRKNIEQEYIDKGYILVKDGEYTYIYSGKKK